MKNLRKAEQKLKNNKGFSLVELIVVIAIMAVLVAVLAPQFIKYVDKSRQSNDAAMVSGVVTAVQTGVADVVSYDIPSAKYKITISEGGLTVLQDDGTIVAPSEGKGSIEDAIKDACGELNKLKRTARLWKAEDIVVTAEVTTEGTVKITYDSKLFADYIGQKGEA